MEEEKDVTSGISLDFDPKKREEEFLEKLGLTEFFPDKITLQTVMERSSTKLDSIVDVPWYFLNKMLMLDHRGRDNIITNGGTSKHEICEKASEGVFSELDEYFSLQSSCSAAPHPMDVFVAVLRCCSNFLRQLIYEKMFMCKLSVPLVLPPFLNSERQFMLFALRGIILERMDDNGKLLEGSASSNPIPIVSCVRIGEIFRSKSKFLNEVLNDQSHPTFYHRDCEGGMNDRTISEGLVEIAWSLRSRNLKKVGDLCGKESVEKSSQFKDLSLLNLRGDGQLHESNMKLISKISDVILAIVDICEIENKEVLKTLNTLTLYKAQLVVMITKKPNSKLDHEARVKIEQFLKEMHRGNAEIEVIYDLNLKSKRNVKDLKNEVEEKISKSLEKRLSATSLKSFDSFQITLEESFDEHDTDCLAGKEKASLVVRTANEGGRDYLRTRKLPLQCKPWEEWSKLNKEEHRRERKGNSDIFSYLGEIYLDKKERRKEQIQILQRPHKIMNEFISNLLNSKVEERLYYLKWLKYFLDDHANELLPGLQSKFQLKWNELRFCEDKLKVTTLQEELTRSEKELADSSFSLQHFIREMAQAYEAIEDQGEETSVDLKQEISYLPKVMAELMLLGYPLELMDGDASGVPIRWISSVLKQLTDMIGDKKIFVLSALGIQSSGKSTLLNTMFGLQFGVAVGRCTRGVYAQLVPIPREYSNEKYDYILVVDTEGLKAAEIGSEKIQHDNEIATLVVGLGDVTMVNIKGENVTEIEDVLQIVVHALLKMKLVNKNLALQPSCIFIHQNVPAADAGLKLRSGHQKFIETLDKATKAAGMQEDSPYYTRFSQIINFDFNNSFFYFSDLRKGDPPMGPTNPGYSENVSEVKRTLLTDIMNKRSSHLTIHKLGVKIKDLWNGILGQNFIFSFKNNLELEAYNYFESELSSILWELKKTALKWQNDKGNEIMSTESKVEGLERIFKVECYNHMNVVYSTSKEKLKEIFEKGDDWPILEQWKSRAYEKVETCYKDIIDKTTQTLNSKVKAKQILVEQNVNIEKYRARIVKGAKDIAEKLRSSDEELKLTDGNLEEQFRDKWNEIINSLPEYERDRINIKERVNKVLYDKFRQDYPLVKKCVEKLHDKELKALSKTFNQIMEAYCEPIGEYGFEGSYMVLTDSYDSSIANFVSKVYEMVDSYFGCGMQSCGFKLEDARMLIQTAKNMAGRFNDSNQVYITNFGDFIIAVTICACQYASSEFPRSYRREIEYNSRSPRSLFGIHPLFEEVLPKQYPGKVMEVLKPKEKKRLKLLKLFEVGNRNIEKIIRKADMEVESYIDRSEIQDFKDEYVEEIIDIINKTVKEREFALFSKEEKISMAVNVCYFAIPKFKEKHKKYMDSLNPRLVLERDHYGASLQIFKNSYYKSTGETALAMVLTERLSTAIGIAVDRGLAADLVDDVRHNVPEVKGKPALLKAILMKLLENDHFEEFMLYLEDSDTCYELWIAYYIESYMFSEREHDINRYSETVFKNIRYLMSRIYEDISKPIPNISEDANDREDICDWIKEFQKRISNKLSITQEELLNLVETYEIHSIGSFSLHLRKCLQEAEGRLKSVSGKYKSRLKILCGCLRTCLSHVQRVYRALSFLFCTMYL